MTHLSSHTTMFMLAIALLIPLATAASAKPEYRTLAHPTVAEMAQGLAKWAEARPKAMRVETVGRTVEGLPMLLCRITDYDYLLRVRERAGLPVAPPLRSVTRAGGHSCPPCVVYL